MLNKRNWVGL